MAQPTLGRDLDNSLRSIIKRLSNALAAITGISLPERYADSRNRKLIDRVNVHLTINYGSSDGPFPVEAQFRLEKDQFGRPIRDSYPDLYTYDADGELALDHTVPMLLAYAGTKLADPASAYTAQARCIAGWGDKGLEFEVYLGGAYTCIVKATWAETYEILSTVYVEYVRGTPMKSPIERDALFAEFIDTQIKSGEQVPAEFVGEHESRKKATLKKKSA